MRTWQPRNQRIVGLDLRSALKGNKQDQSGSGEMFIQIAKSLQHLVMIHGLKKDAAELREPRGGMCPKKGGHICEAS